ncbi:MAG TPA: GNAT family N-acetyltransferase [Actinoplanes sp.]|nr:GNAT family N-acetyltransferase [Actinoplanes sp.]
MTLTFVVDPELTGDLRDRILRLWVEVTNAGGAVGFVAPVTTADVRPLAEQTLADVASGVDHLLAGFDDGELVALLFVASNRFALKEHWRVLKRVMVAPGRQGRGYGAALMREATAVARKLGLEALQVTVRGGTGTERFYQRLGYREVGRLPGALRVGPGDDRDEFILWLSCVG